MNMQHTHPGHRGRQPVPLSRLVVAGATLLLLLVIAPAAALAAKPTTGTSGAAAIALSGFTGAAAGSPVTITVKALDRTGKVFTGYQGTVSFTSTDPGATLPGSYRFVSADKGVRTFVVTFTTAGSQQLRVADTVTASLAASQTAPVAPGAAVGLALTGLADETAGTRQGVRVTVRDAFGNVASGFTGTASFTSTDTAASLPADYAFTAADAGTHAFAVTLKTAGTQTVTATSGVLTDAHDSVVTAAHAARIQLVADAGLPLYGGIPTGTAGTAMNLTVRALDAFGNIDTAYTGTVAFTPGDCAWTAPTQWVRLVIEDCPRAYTFTGADAGQRTFTGLILRKSRVYNERSVIGAADTSDSRIGGSIAYMVLPAAPAAYSACPKPVSAEANVLLAGKTLNEIGVNDPIGLNFAVLDQFGNGVNIGKPALIYPFTLPAGYTGSATVSSSDAQAAIVDSSVGFADGGGTFVTGQFSVAVRFRTAGTQSFTLTDDSSTNPLPSRTCSFSIRGPEAYNGSWKAIDPRASKNATSRLQVSGYAPLNDPITVVDVSGPVTADGTRVGSTTAWSWDGVQASPNGPSKPPAAYLEWDLANGGDVTCDIDTACPAGPIRIAFRIVDAWGNTSSGRVSVDFFLPPPVLGSVPFDSLTKPTYLVVNPAVEGTPQVALGTPVTGTVTSINTDSLVLSLPAISVKDGVTSGSTAYAGIVVPSGSTFQTGDTISLILGYQPTALTTTNGTPEARSFASVTTYSADFFGLSAYNQNTVLYCIDSLGTTCYDPELGVDPSY